jgi:hypothetical protein
VGEGNVKNLSELASVTAILENKVLTAILIQLRTSVAGFHGGRTALNHSKTGHPISTAALAMNVSVSLLSCIVLSPALFKRYY